MASKKSDLAIILGGKPPEADSEDDDMDEGPAAVELIQQAIDSGDPEAWKAAIQACMSEDY